MKSTPIKVLVSSGIVVGSVALAIAMWALFKKSPEQRPDNRKQHLVTFAPVQPFEQDVKIQLTGVTIPFREITIAAEVSGAITEKTDECQAGHFVNEGDHLISIDPKRYQLAVDRLKSEIKEAQARIDKVKSELKAAKEVLNNTLDDYQKQESEFQKRKMLKERNAISEIEFLQSARTFNAAKNAKITQESRVESLGADLSAQDNLLALKRIQLEEAEYDLTKAKISAPAKGVVISDDVQKDDFVQVGKQLLVFEDTSKAEVRCDLRADQLQTILEMHPANYSKDGRIGLPNLDATIRYETDDYVYQWRGKLERFDGLGLNERTRTAPCIIMVNDTLSVAPELQNEDESGQELMLPPVRRRLLRGMYVSIELNLKKRPGLLAIPAVAERAGEMVWVFERAPEGGIEIKDEDGKVIEVIKPAENEELGFLKKVKLDVFGRVRDGDGKEWIIVKERNQKRKEGSLQKLTMGDLLIGNPVPQAVEGMILRHKLGDPVADGLEPTDSQPVDSQPVDSQPTTNVSDSESDERVEQGQGGTRIPVVAKSRQEVAQ